MRKSLVLVPVAIFMLLTIFVNKQPLEAKDKDELIKLQADVQALQREISMLRESAASNTGKITTLLEKAVDSVNTVQRDFGDTRTFITRSLEDVSTNTKGASDQISRLNNRLNATDQRLERLQAQLEDVKRYFSPTQIITNCDNGEQQFNTAYADYLRGNYSLAVAQFQNYVNCFPQTEGAGVAQFYIADSIYRKLDYQQSIVEFDKLLTAYPANKNVPVARYKKADALLKTEKRKEAEAELRLLIQNHPGTPEASQAQELIDQLPPEPATKPPVRPTGRKR